jgi:sterol desaturase/sphingolipid hydroxylase (fatty acid hydroxylase superfamily)
MGSTTIYFTCSLEAQSMAINYIALAVPVFFALIGVELLVARRRGIEVYRVNDAITDLSCGMGSQVVGVFLKGVLLAGYAYCFDHLRLVSWPEGSWVPWAIAFVGVDLLYYWWHRLSHEVAFMWAIHVVHHQSEDYNLAVALRQAWFSSATSWFFYVPLAFVGVPPLVFAAMVAFSTLYQFWIHTRTIGTLGPLEIVLNTASHHRVHHGRNPKYIDRNYAASLIVWDRIFGTFQEEEEEPYYGVIAPYASWNPLWANVDFWAHLVRKARALPRLADKIRVFFKGPGWYPPGQEPDLHTDVTNEPPVRHVTVQSRGLSAYILAQYVPALAMTVVLMMREAEASSIGTIALAAIVLVTTLGWGAFFERKVWALPLELVRLVSSSVLATAGIWSGVISAPLFVAALVWVGVSIVWALALRLRVAEARGEAVVARGA